MEAIYGQTAGKYTVEERKCMITGDDICEFVVSVLK